MRRAAAALLLMTAGVTHAAPAPRADPTVAARADALVGLLADDAAYDGYFAESFRVAVPRATLDPLFDQLRATLGVPQRIASLVPTSGWTADIVVAYERGTATMRIAVDPAAPHRVTGLYIVGTGLRDDSLDRVMAEIRTLPGDAGIGLYTLGEGAPRPIARYRAELPAPIGSAFKLWVLEASGDAVARGQRRWADVVPSGPPSLPSGMMQDWPVATPVTLQTLAALMIAISDNTATDTLIHAIGRDAVDRSAGAPVPTTRELFALKGDATLAGEWAAADPIRRRGLLADIDRRIGGGLPDAGIFSGKPVAIDSVEWFASPAAMATTLDRLRTGDPVARAILAINHGVDPTTAARFAYLGYKGGSEPGVIAANFLAQAKDGRWYALSANWHRADTGVNDQRFLALMTRLLQLVAG